MCGIWGLKDKSLAVSLRMEMAKRSNEILKHRGPDDSGEWHDDEHGLSLTHRRLAILDLSEHGRQPMLSASGRYCMVFNGEVYNFERLRKQLRDEGHAPEFRGGSDTEVMLACFDAWGVAESVRKFIGMFAFGVWDRVEHRLWLARDPMGIKPLYYFIDGDRIAFASEIKGLVFMEDERLSIDMQSTALFLKYGYVPAPRSIYTSIKKLPQGGLLCCDFTPDGRLTNQVKTRFWSLQDCARQGMLSPFTGSDEDAEDCLSALLSDSTGMCMISDVPIGAFLSGGIDSSCIVSLMRQFTPHKIRTFTIRFDDAAHDESQHARAVANHLGTEHTELLVTQKDLLESTQTLVESFDEPFADSSQIPTYAVSRLAREHVTVILSGDGGDELFCGYPSYATCGSRWEMASHLSHDLKTMLGSILRRVPDNVFDNTKLLSKFFKSPTNMGSEKIDTLIALLDARSPHEFYDNAITPYKRYEDLLSAKSPRRLPPAGLEPPSGLSPISSMMFHDTTTFLPDDILVKVDRASMAVALEARVPFLDHRVVEFAWSLPLRNKLRGGIHKYVLRNLLYRHVPKDIVDRPKKGFTIPLAAWLRGALRDWADAELFDKGAKESGVLCMKSVQRLWNEHQDRRADRSSILWGLIVLTRFLRSRNAHA
ncbi:asparagine synthase (glutamine-hydrolyzing) [Fundidesulfovibrio terrae]|uniref:asparagine synthase (glutamine-hydrolyzing) n=1 Tax=Fundidesulfovibrio terrae TaxID=2922866 RepID=UPI001FAF5A82|nr:asparagine synthase (glutamine-hydrolyzing) [Fundidesulfovibrio terrae]